MRSCDGLGALTREMRREARADALETGLAAERSESGLIRDIGQIGVGAVGPAAPHGPFEHGQRLIAPALNRPDRCNVGVESEGDRPLAIDGADRGVRLAEQPVGIRRSPCLPQSERDHRRFVQLVRPH